GTRIPVPISYTRLTDTTIGFTVGSYDRTLPLVIDPVYTWHTFYGSNNDDHGYGIAVDKDGNVYVTGVSTATWGAPINPHSGLDDIVVLKLDSSGTLLWHTFHGSNGDDEGYGIAVDNDGNIYVTGYSSATWGAPINPHSGWSDIVVLKLNSSGALLWHTFHGSSSNDDGQGIAVDKDGNVYVTGVSTAAWGTPIAPHSGAHDIVVLKLDSTGTRLWNTFYGSNNTDIGSGIAVDKDGNVYVTGYSYATWGSPITPHSGGWDIAVLKLDSSGTRLWHTFHGSNEYDYGYGIAVDNDGNVYVTGTSIAAWGTPITPHSGLTDMVVLKLGSSGTLLWHTFYGSNEEDYGSGIAVDNDGNVYVTGISTAAWGTPMNPHSGNYDIAVLKLNSSGNLLWHTFYGSDGYDYGQGIAVDKDGNVYVTGRSYAAWGTPMNPHNGSYDIVVVKLLPILSPSEGTIGTRITIHGAGFGTKKGKVLINNMAAKIAKGGWTPDRITATINKPPMPTDVPHPVTVVVNKASTTVDGTFTLRRPVLDDLATASGTYKDAITVTGKFFSTKKGKAYLMDPITGKKKNLKVASWQMNEQTGISEFTFIVPKTSKSFPAKTYHLIMGNKVGQAATTPEFTVLGP
ncbi:MAG: SBBP repeat-containing protein, partial [Syntrophorhabdus sp.]|nr:SBBP repeat-containing protein [Syntrophorhabdus sp.]